MIIASVYSVGKRWLDYPHPGLPALRCAPQRLKERKGAIKSGRQRVSQHDLGPRDSSDRLDQGRGGLWRGWHGPCDSPASPFTLLVLWELETNGRGSLREKEEVGELPQRRLCLRLVPDLDLGC